MSLGGCFMSLCSQLCPLTNFLTFKKEICLHHFLTKAVATRPVQESAHTKDDLRKNNNRKVHAFGFTPTFTELKVGRFFSH